MKNIPKKVYLQIGDNIADDIEFKELSLDAITLSFERLNKSDICYILKQNKK